MKDDLIVKRVLTKLNLMEDYDGYKFNMAWCNSFILNRSVVDRFYDIVKDEKPSGRYKGSVQSERYLSAILYYLNNKRYINLW